MSPDSLANSPSSKPTSSNPSGQRTLGGAPEVHEPKLQPTGTDSEKLEQSHPRMTNMLRLLNYAYVRSRSTVQDDSCDEIELPCPERIGRFLIHERLGVGGFADVFSAWDETLHRQVALKVIRKKEAEADEGGRLEEARLAARLNHPNLVPLYEVLYDPEGRVCMVSEFCDGPTLSAWQLNQKTDVACKDAASLVADVARGVSHSHRKGLIHRDIKPSNILLVPRNKPSQDAPLQGPPSQDAPSQGLSSPEVSGPTCQWTAKLTDFGLAQDVFRLEGNASYDVLAGTLPYLSPEQVLSGGSATSFASDIYSIGVVLYRLLVGKLPFEDRDPVKVIAAICGQSPTPPRALRSKIPRDLEMICLKCLEKEPGDRYASAEQLAEDLERYLADDEVSVRRWTPMERCAKAIVRHRHAAAVVSVILVGAAIAVLIASSSFQSQMRLEQQGATAQRVQTQQLKDQAIAKELEVLEVKYRLLLKQGFQAATARDYTTASEILRQLRSRTYKDVAGDLELRMLQLRASAAIIPLQAHAAPIEDMAYLSSLDAFAVTSLEGWLRIHSAATGRLVQEHDFGRDLALRSLCLVADDAMSANASSLAIGTAAAPSIQQTRPNDVSLYSPKTLSAQTIIRNRKTTIESLAYAPTSQRLAVGCRYEDVELFDLAKPNLPPIVIPNVFRSEDLCFSNDGKRLLLMPKTETFQIVELADEGNDFNERLSFQTEGLITRFTWSEDNRWIACAHRELPLVIVFDLNHSPPRRIELECKHAVPESIAIDVGWHQIYAGLRDGHLLSWDLRELQATNDQPPRAHDHGVLHESMITCIAASPNGCVATGSEQGTASILCRKNSMRARLAIDDRVLTTATLSQDGRVAVLGCADGSVHSVAVGDESPSTMILPEHPSPVTYSTLSNRFNAAAIGWADGSMAIIDLDDNSVIFACERPEQVPKRWSQVTRIFQSPSGQRFCVLHADLHVAYYEVATLPGGQPIVPCGVSDLSDEAHVAGFVDEDNLVLIGERRWALPFGAAYEMPLGIGWGQIIDGLFDERTGDAFTCVADGRIRCHDAKGQLIHQSARWENPHVKGSALDTPTTLTISPDGKLLALGDASGCVSLWHSEDLTLIGQVAESVPDTQVSKVEFSSQGDRLVILRTATQNSAQPQAGFAEVFTFPADAPADDSAVVAPSER